MKAHGLWCAALLAACEGSSASSETEASDSTGNATDTSDPTSDATDSSDSTGGVDSGSGSSGSSGADTTTGGPTMVDLEGAVAKGPFVLGSSVSLAELDMALEPTGVVFQTQTDSDLGEFALSVETSGVLEAEAVGFYYNEVTGDLSQSTLTLRALYPVSDLQAQQAFINVVTHLTHDRVKSLYAGGTTFVDAIAQAEDELLVALGVGVPGFDPAIAGTGLNVLGGDTDANAYLLAVGTVLAQAAVTRAGGVGGPVDAHLQELVNTISDALAAGGQVSTGLHDELLQAQRDIDPSAVMAAFQARLDMLGAMVVPPNIDRVLDSDLDGIANIDDNCRWVENALQEDADGDGVGDACECGNGSVDPGETCDDGNAIDLDVCSNDCLPTCELAIDWTAVPGPRAVAALGDVLLYADADGLWTLQPDGTTDNITASLTAYDFEQEGVMIRAIDPYVVFGWGPGHNTGIWATDGTAAGTEQIATEVPVDMAAEQWNGRIYFSTTHELWSTDGTAAGTELVAMTAPYLEGYSFTPFGGQLYFRGAPNLGIGLWVTDGTAAGTQEVMNGGSMAAINMTRMSAGANGLVLLEATGVDTVVWVSDGTAAGTLQVPNQVAFNNGFMRWGDLVAFRGAVPGGPAGVEPFASDGTAAGTGLVVDAVAGNGDSLPTIMGEASGSLLFTTWDGIGAGQTLTATDGTPDDVNALVTIDWIDPVDSWGALDAVYVKAWSPADGWELWRSNGTVADTFRVTDLPFEAQVERIVRTTSSVFVQADQVNDMGETRSLWRCAQ